MAALHKSLRATMHVLTLRETFQIARGAADEETVVVADLRAARVDEVRGRLPVLRHRRPEAYRVKAHA